MDGVLDQFHALADEYLEYALRGEIARLLQRQRHPGRTVPGRQQIASLRRRPGPDGRGAFRRHRAVPPLCRFRRARAGHTSPPASIARSRPIFCTAATSIPSTIATPAGRARCAPAAAITKPSCATATPAIRICTTAIGFATGPTPVCRFMARSRAKNPGFLASSLPKGKHHETPASL